MIILVYCMAKIILAGSGTYFLPLSVSKEFQIGLHHGKVTHFVNSEMKVRLPDGISKSNHVFILQSTSNPSNNNLMEICLATDTLQRIGVKKITAVIPYFGYARQDREHLERECVSVKLVAKLLKASSITEVITVDIHNESCLGELAIPMKNISAVPELAQQIYKDLGLNKDTEGEFTIASPDQGGIKRAQLFAENFFKNKQNIGFVSIKKERTLDKAHVSRAVELVGEIKDKKIIMVDDISTSGGTLLNALELCQQNGVKETYSVVIHPDFAPGVAEKLQQSDFTKIYTTNSIEKTVDNLMFYNKIQVLDIGKTIGEAILGSE
jgi:ribose-phosphate pyrophosphokinase